METVTLNDGTVLNGHCIETDTALFVYLDGLPIMDGILLFADETKTSRIVAVNHGHEHIYEGYTRLSAASSEYGNCNLMMKRGETNVNTDN